MNWLPRDTILGELTLLETYVFYDGPRLFSAQSLTDQRYLAAWANEGHEADEWLYVAISEARLNMVRSGARTVRSAFLEPEGFTYRVIIPHDDSSPDSAKTVVPSEILDAWLPGENFRIAESTATTRAYGSTDARGWQSTCRYPRRLLPGVGESCKPRRDPEGQPVK